MRQALRDLVRLAFGMIEVLEAASVGEALHTVEGRKVDVVLMDIRLPGVDGLTGARRLLARSPGAAILIVSNLDDPFHRKAAGRAGARGFISKRMLCTELAPAIASLLAAGPGRPPAEPDRQSALRHQESSAFDAAGGAPPAGTA